MLESRKKEGGSDQPLETGRPANKVPKRRRQGQWQSPRQRRQRQQQRQGLRTSKREESGEKNSGKIKECNGIEICFKYNNGEGKCEQGCPRAHVCQWGACNGARHPLASCEAYKRQSQKVKLFEKSLMPLRVLLKLVMPRALSAPRAASKRENLQWHQSAKNSHRQPSHQNLRPSGRQKYYKLRRVGE